MDYRRSQAHGGTFFFTLVTYQRAKLFTDLNKINLFRAAIQKVKQRHPFTMQAYVLLPDHFHCIWTLPENDDDFSTRWRLIKNYFTRNCFASDKSKQTLVRQRKKEQCIWQRRFWEHTIQTERDYENHVEYIHYNPVKHGYVASPTDWRYSSIHYYIEQEKYPENWGEGRVIKSGNIRE